jgi:shikimate dehydrogenase
MAAREGASKITILARNLKEAEKLAAGLKAIFPGVLVHAGEMEAAAMSEAACDADVLLNATPLGMEGSKENFRSFGFLKKLPARALVYDLVYKPGRTELLRKAAEIGLAVQNGLGMLIYQGILADQIFLGRKLDRYALYSAVKEEIKDDHRIKTGRD